MSGKYRNIITKGQSALLIALLVIILDQALKIWVKTTFWLGESREITSWFYLVFVENNGMAFGWELGSKLFLTLFRILFSAFLVYYIIAIRKSGLIKRGYMICVALILAGAIGNIIDCVFYGVIFNNPLPPQTATLFPVGGGYAPLFHGRVVDMLSFPLFTIVWPQWLPWIGGTEFSFFRPIFNLADSAITVGVFAVILFYSNQISVSKDVLKERFAKLRKKQ